MNKTDLKSKHPTPSADIARGGPFVPPPILTLSPRLGPRSELKKLTAELAKAGYLAIIAEPDQVKVLEVITVAPMAAVTKAALRAIRADSSYTVKQNFANAVCDALAPAEPK